MNWNFFASNSCEYKSDSDRFMMSGPATKGGILKQPKPVRASVNHLQRKFQSVNDFVARPTNPIVKDAAFTRANNQ